MTQHRALCLLSTLALFTCLSQPAIAANEVKLEKLENRVSVTIGGKPFTDYYFAAEGGRDYVRPFMYPVRAADGTIITSDQKQLVDAEKDHPKPKGEAADHPHHRSLYVAHGDVNGADHWSLNQVPIPKQRHIKFTKVEGDTLVEELGWEGKGGTDPILHETRTVRFHVLEDGSRAIDITSVFTPLVDKVTFGDTKEAGLCSVRMVKSISDKPALTNSTGAAGEKNVWGKAADWCDLSGSIDGKPYGAAILDHPSNPRHPTRWHAREYGLFTANPFGLSEFDKAPKGTGDLTIKKGDAPLSFRYRVVIHAGDAKAAKIEADYKKFAAEK